MKKVLIISASFGSGHVQAAKALEQELLDSFQHIATVNHIDLLSYLPHIFRQPAKKGYLFLSTQIPLLWKCIYHATNHPHIYTPIRYISSRISQIFYRGFFSYIQKMQPDTIICTHPFPAQLLQKKSFLHHTPIHLVITDYDIHPFWITPNIQTYFVPTDTVAKKMSHIFSIKETVIVSGIPVHPALYQNSNHDDITSQYMIPKDHRVILILMGGTAHAKMPQIVQTICSTHTDNDSTIIAIAGKNTSVLKKLEKLADTLPKHTLIALGWTTEIPKLISIADIIIGKPGGMTVSEAMATNTPFIALYPTPGQEEANTNYLLSENKGYYAKNVQEVPMLITKIFEKKSSYLPKKVKRSTQIILNHILKEA